MSVFASDLFYPGSIPLQPAFLYANYGASAAISASSTLSGTAAANLLQPDEAQGWSPASTSSAVLTINLGVQTLCSYLAMVGANCSGASVAISGSPDGITYTSLLSAQVLPNDIANWLQFTPVTCQYLQVTISGQSSTFALKHITPGNLVLLPFFADDFCITPIQAEGTNLISFTGLYLGSVTQKVTMPFDLNFDQITPAEEQIFAAWVAACIVTAQGFFLVPDTSQPDCYFGCIADRNWKYEPKMQIGLFTLPAIPFTARAL